MTASQPAFLIGVTGHMDLDPAQVPLLEERVERLLRFLKSTPDAPQRPALLKALVQDLAPDDAQAAAMCTAALSSWGGLEHTPIVVLSSLAPGADSLVARVAVKLAREPEFLQGGLSVQAPLPFPHDLYGEASTFVWKGADGKADRESPENRRRRQDYDELVAAVGGPSQTFPVWLESDRQRTAPAGQLAARHHQQCALDRDAPDATARRARYRAAGEYLAAYAHLLIAIWDQEDDHETDVGTAAIVEARRAYLKPHLLPNAGAVGLPHGGPLVHLTTRRLKNKAAAEAGALPPVRFLFPYATAPISKATGQPVADADPEWQQNSLALLCRIAANLDDFNATQVPSDHDVDKEFDTRLTRIDSDKGPDTLTCSLKEQHREFHDALYRVAAVRRRAVNDTVHYHGASLRVLKRLFGLTLLAAATLHLFAHWHPQDEGPAAEEQTTNDSEHPQTPPDPPEGPTTDEQKSVESASGTHRPKVASTVGRHAHAQAPIVARASAGASPVRPLLGMTVVVMAVAALWLFWKHKRQFDDEHDHDCRALAEGLRVQFYWDLAGLGESVSANYLQRQRSELDWVRGVIRWSSFPYERWRTWFDELPPDTQIAAIECAHHAWVADQCRYFRNAASKRRHELHVWHKLGFTLALAGLLGFLALTCALLVPATGWLAFGLAFSTALVAAIGLGWGTVRRSRASPQDAHGQQNNAPSLWGFLEAWLYRYVPTIDEPSWQTITSHQRSREMWANFLAYLLPAATIAAAGLAFSTLLGLWPHLPGAFDLAIVFAGWCLLGGAMSVAWAEKNLCSELAYQYGTMATLFRSAERRLSELVVRLRASANDPAAFAQTMAEVREVLLDLGKEALDEHAEWLILHRARPLEPVMAA
jgi:hypothetical protein